MSTQPSTVLFYSSTRYIYVNYCHSTGVIFNGRLTFFAGFLLIPWQFGSEKGVRLNDFTPILSRIVRLRVWRGFGEMASSNNSNGSCVFNKVGTTAESRSSDHAHQHSHSHQHGHSHDHQHGHTHEIMDSPGSYTERDKPLYRNDWESRAFTVGIGGPVGSGKTAIVLALCRHLRDSYGVCVVTNDIFTREDWEFLVRNKALSEERMRAVETGGCPHAAIREDFSLNMEEVKELSRKFEPQIVFIESGGDNLAANFSRELADYIIYVIDVAGGDKVPRKGGPGITQSDLLVINKTDLAAAVGADLEVMSRDAKLMRQEGPTLFTQAKNGVGVADVANSILSALRLQTGLS